MRSTFFKSRGVPVKTVLAATGLENINVIMTAVILFLLTNQTLGTFYLGYRILAIFLLLITMFSPHLMIIVINMVHRLFRKEEIRGKITRVQSASFTILAILSS